MNVGRLILALGLGYFTWRVLAQRGPLPERINAVTQEIVRGGFVPIKPKSYTMTNAHPHPNFDVRPLLDLIARAEANMGYDSYYAASRVRPFKPISQMTLSEIKAFQEHNAAAGSASTAVGRYQFIQRTLEMLVTQSATPNSAIFNAALQDNFALMLLRRRNLDAFIAGTITAEQFATNLSREWAGLPRGPDNISYYAGTAGNRASVRWDEILHVLEG